MNFIELLEIWFASCRDISNVAQQIRCLKKLALEDYKQRAAMYGGMPGQMAMPGMPGMPGMNPGATSIFKRRFEFQKSFK